MGTRSTYLRRIEQLEAAVIGFGRGVARRRPGTRAAHHRAIELAVDALTGSPLAEPDDVRRIRAAPDVDFHVRHIDRLLEIPAANDGPRPELEAALGALERVLETAERPLLRDGVASAPDARLRRVALHVLAVAEAARSRVPTGRTRPAAPVA